jgi:hypothetical protein
MGYQNGSRPRKYSDLELDIHFDFSDAVNDAELAGNMELAKNLEYMKASFLRYKNAVNREIDRLKKQIDKTGKSE